MGSSEQRQENETDFPDGQRVGTQPPGMPSCRGFCCSPFCYLAHNRNDLANNVAAGAPLSRYSTAARISAFFVHKIPIEFIWYASVISPVDGVWTRESGCRHIGKRPTLPT